MNLVSNVVNNKYLSELYLSILDDLASKLVRSYGPFGSNSLIQKGADTFPIYTKDGHTILSNIKYHNIIERTITSNILSITEHIVKTVGDGTTSAVLLSRNILKGLLDIQSSFKESNTPVAPIQIVNEFKRIVKIMCDQILKNGREFTIDDAYAISMISTNGDVEISKQIETLYKELGKEVYIELTTTSQKQDIVSIYDGLVLESGLIEECYINDPDKQICHLDRPAIYAFQDPIDTPEMIGLFEEIVSHNIYSPLQQILNGKKEESQEQVSLIPTVIITPRMSRDASALMEHITEVMNRMSGGMVRKRPPILVITNLESVDQDQYADIMTMCGCPPIKKYINPEVQQVEQEKGIAPTRDNVWRFFGTCDAVEADHYKTSFFRPSQMFTVITDEGGVESIHKSEKYNGLINFLETELSKAKEAKQDYVQIYHLKKRLNSLKAVFVEWHVGGVSPADRDQRMSTIEDAVKNCRSAARDGVGYGANFEAFRVIYHIRHDTVTRSMLTHAIICVLYDAYTDLVKTLYHYIWPGDDLKEEKLRQMIQNGYPFNIADVLTDDEDKIDLPVLSSIQSDVMILEGIANLITIMATSNQYICPQPMDAGVYIAEEAIRKEKEDFVSKTRKENKPIKFVSSQYSPKDDE